MSVLLVLLAVSQLAVSQIGKEFSQAGVPLTLRFKDCCRFDGFVANYIDDVPTKEACLKICQERADCVAVDWMHLDCTVFKGDITKNFHGGKCPEPHWCYTKPPRPQTPKPTPKPKPKTTLKPKPKTTSKPKPTTSKPKPTTSKPKPTTSKPKPTTSKPKPTSAPKSCLLSDKWYSDDYNSGVARETAKIEAKNGQLVVTKIIGDAFVHGGTVTWQTLGGIPKVGGSTSGRIRLCARGQRFCRWKTVTVTIVSCDEIHVKIGGKVMKFFKLKPTKPTNPTKPTKPTSPQCLLSKNWYSLDYRSGVAKETAKVELKGGQLVATKIIGDAFVRGGTVTWRTTAGAPPLGGSAKSGQIYACARGQRFCRWNAVTVQVISCNEIHVRFGRRVLKFHKSPGSVVATNVVALGTIAFGGFGLAITGFLYWRKHDNSHDLLYQQISQDSL